MVVPSASGVVGLLCIVCRRASASICDELREDLAAYAPFADSQHHQLLQLSARPLTSAAAKCASTTAKQVGQMCGPMAEICCELLHQYRRVDRLTCPSDMIHRMRGRVSFSDVLSSRWPLFGLQYGIQAQRSAQREFAGDRVIFRDHQAVSSAAVLLDTPAAYARDVLDRKCLLREFRKPWTSQCIGAGAALSYVLAPLPHKKLWNHDGIGGKVVLTYSDAPPHDVTAHPPRCVGNASSRCRDGAMRFADSVQNDIFRFEGADESCRLQETVWKLLHRAHLRLAFGIDPPLIDDVLRVVQNWRGSGRCGAIYPSLFGLDRWIAEDVFCCRRGGYYVDVGAAHGWRLSNTYALDAFLGWRGLCADVAVTDPDEFRQIRTCDVQEGVAVWRRSGESRRFFVPERSQKKGLGVGAQTIRGHGSLEADDGEPAMGRAWRELNIGGDSWNWTISQTVVETRSLLDTVRKPVARARLDSIDVLSIDAEGQDYDILDGFFGNSEAVRPHVRVIVVETGQDGAKMKRLLERNGYRLAHAMGEDHGWLHSTVVPCL